MEPKVSSLRKKKRGLKQGEDKGKFKNPQPRKGKEDRQNRFAGRDRQSKARAGLWAAYSVVSPVGIEHDPASSLAAPVEGAEIGKEEVWADAREASKAEV